MIGVGSSRDSEARGLLNVGNSVVLTEGLAVTLSEIEAMEDLGGGELSSIVTDARGFSTEGSASGEAVTERLGAGCPRARGGALSPVLTVDSETTEYVGLGRVKPWARLDSLSLIFVGGRASFLELVGESDRTGGDELMEET